MISSLRSPVHAAYLRRPTDVRRATSRCSNIRIDMLPHMSIGIFCGINRNSIRFVPLRCCSFNPQMKESKVETVDSKTADILQNGRLRISVDHSESSENSVLSPSRFSAAQVLTTFLAKDIMWQNRTMQALEMPSIASTLPGVEYTTKSTESTISIQRDSTVFKYYYNLYRDSLESFTNVLANNPPLQLYPALDQLVQGGLGQFDFRDTFLRTKAAQSTRLELVATIRAKEKYLKEKELKTREIETEIDVIKLLMLNDSKPKTKEAARKSEKFKMWQKLLRRSSTTKHPTRKQYQTVDDGPTEIPSSSDHTSYKNHMSLRDRLRKQERKLKQALLDIDSTKLYLAKVREASDASKMQISDPKFQQASDVVNEVMNDVCIAFAKHISDINFHKLQQYRDLDAKTDLTHPHNWFAYARLDKRKIIYHGGPTNSGKTFEALERLKQAKNGIYLAPLRLLAGEVYEKLTLAGVYCNLHTGQERKAIPFSTHSSATVEMASFQDEYDVIVIDEIQMMNDDERGFAWTRALLGSRSKEIHVCGGLEAVDIVRRIAKACNDDFELREYQRFTALRVADSSLSSEPDKAGAYRNVRPGDCVVAFSRNDIFAIKREIESSTKYKCCIIYGSLPPSTRAEQAKLFNDPDSGYDILVASDAIGMGLNLSIKRIIFNSIYKNDGTTIVRLDHSAIKQISGRAGRRNSPFPDGEVTTRDPRDLPYLQQCMNSDIKPITKAGLLPTTSHIELFSMALDIYNIDPKKKHLHHILTQFSEMASLQSDFFLCRQTPMVVIARKLAKLDLSIREKYMLCMCPVIINSEKSMGVLLRFAAKLSTGEVSGLTYDMNPRAPKTFADLGRLCSIYNELEVFLWLQQKIPPGNMLEEQAALARKERTIHMIGEGLLMSDKLVLDHSYINRDKRLRADWKKKEQDKDNIALEDNWNDGIADV